MSEEQDVPKPAWSDPDDLILDKEGLSVKHPKYQSKPGALYRERLVEQYEAIHGKPEWAQLKKKQTQEEDEDTSSDESETDGKDGRKQMRYSGLGKKLKFHRLKNLNLDENNGSINVPGDIIHSIQFHPKHQIALVGDSKGRVMLYKVDMEQRTKFGGPELKNVNIFHAIFSTDGEEIYMSCGKEYFYVFNVQTGKISKINPDVSRGLEGGIQIYVGPDNDLFYVVTRTSIYIYTRQSKEIVGILYCEDVTGIAFDSDGNLIAANGYGQICTYDMKTRSCLRVSRVASDDGLTCVAYSKIADTVALGTETGIVRIKPLVPAGNNTTTGIVTKDVKNLSTTISVIVKNHTEELFAFASKESKNAVRLYDVRGCSVVPNFPGKDYMGRINSVNFSPHSGFLGLGNNRGEAILYRLQNYEDY